jgi:plastocyanin
MATDITMELLLAGVGAGVGLFFGVSRFVTRQSSGLRGHRSRMKRHRRVKDAITYVPRPFEEIERDYEMMKKEFAAREEHRKKELAAREEHRRILRSAFDPDPSAVHVGDTVVFAFEDAPERHITVTLTRDMRDTSHGIIPMTHPIARS